MVQISVALSVPFSAHRTSIDFCRNRVCETSAECVIAICTADKKEKKILYMYGFVAHHRNTPLLD